VVVVVIGCGCCLENRINMLVTMVVDWVSKALMGLLSGAGILLVLLVAYVIYCRIKLKILDAFPGLFGCSMFDVRCLMLESSLLYSDSSDVRVSFV